MKKIIKIIENLINVYNHVINTYFNSDLDLISKEGKEILSKPNRRKIIDKMVKKSLENN